MHTKDLRMAFAIAILVPRLVSGGFGQEVNQKQDRPTLLINIAGIQSDGTEETLKAASLLGPETLHGARSFMLTHGPQSTQGLESLLKSGSAGSKFIVNLDMNLGGIGTILAKGSATVGATLIDRNVGKFVGSALDAVPTSWNIETKWAATTTEQLATAFKAKHPDGVVLLVGHSAGTDAIDQVPLRVSDSAGKTTQLIDVRILASPRTGELRDQSPEARARTYFIEVEHDLPKSPLGNIGSPKASGDLSKQGTVIEIRNDFGVYGLNWLKAHTHATDYGVKSVVRVKDESGEWKELLTSPREIIAGLINRDGRDKIERKFAYPASGVSGSEKERQAFLAGINKELTQGTKSLSINIGRPSNLSEADRAETLRRLVIEDSRKAVSKAPSLEFSDLVKVPKELSGWTPLSASSNGAPSIVARPGIMPDRLETAYARLSEMMRDQEYVGSLLSKQEKSFYEMYAKLKELQGSLNQALEQQRDWEGFLQSHQMKRPDGMGGSVALSFFRGLAQANWNGSLSSRNVSAPPVIQRTVPVRRHRIYESGSSTNLTYSLSDGPATLLGDSGPRSGSVHVYSAPSTSVTPLSTNQGPTGTLTQIFDGARD